MGRHFLVRTSEKMIKNILIISLLVTAILAKPRAKKLARSKESSSWEWPSSWDEFSSGDWPSSWDYFSSVDIKSSWFNREESSSSSWEWPSSMVDFSSDDFPSSRDDISSGDIKSSWFDHEESSSSWDWPSSWESSSGLPAGQ